jgi:Kyakuja-Dileera-Zisupton transposase
MLKRAGRGHDPNGVEATTKGECAVICPACPQPGKNLPDGWESTPDDQQWLYTLFVGIDANFKLKRRKVSSEKVDPSFSKGWSYFVEEQPYKLFLDEHGNQPQEKSTCSNYDAMAKANSKDARYLDITGAGTVDCVRHDMKRPNGVGDIQKGER